VRLISLEQSVPKTLFFGAPCVPFGLRTGLRAQLPAPFNASVRGGADVCRMQQTTGATMRTPRNRLLQIVEIRDPSW